MRRDTESLLRREFLAPRYWADWLLFGLMLLLSRLPYRLTMPLGRLAGLASLHLARYRRHIAETNLALCFPDTPRETRDQWLREQFQSLGMAAVETALVWLGKRSKVTALLQETEGLEHLDRALADGRGAILLAGHFIDLEIGTALCTSVRPGAAVYRPHKNLLFDAVMARSRTRHGKALRRDDTRGMIRWVRNNSYLWYAPDQNYEGPHSVFAPFFGIPAATNAAAGRLARITGAPVLTFTQQRLPGDRGYRLVFGPPVAGIGTGDAAADAARINQIIEGMARARPAHYLWVHRRFKSRPEGEPKLYRPKRRRRRKRQARAAPG